MHDELFPRKIYNEVIPIKFDVKDTYINVMWVRNVERDEVRLIS